MIRPFASGSLEWSWDVAQVDLFRVSSSFVCHTFTLFPQIQILHQATRLLQWGNGPRHSVLSTAEAYWMDFILPRHRACCKLPCGGPGSVVALSLSLRGGTLGEMASAVLSFTHRYDRTEAQGRLSRQVRNYKTAQQRLCGHRAFPFLFILFLLISLSLYCFPEKKTNPIWWFWGRAVRKWESWGECFPLQPILEKGRGTPEKQDEWWRPWEEMKSRSGGFGPASKTETVDGSLLESETTGMTGPWARFHQKVPWPRDSLPGHYAKDIPNVRSHAYKGPARSLSLPLCSWGNQGSG